MPIVDTHRLPFHSLRLGEDGGSLERTTFTGPIALAVIVFVGVALTFLTRYILHRRHLRLAQKSPSRNAESDAQRGARAGVFRASAPRDARGNAVDCVGDFDLDSWRIDPGDGRGESGPLQQLRQPPDVALARSFPSLGSVGSRLRTGLCMADDDAVRANSVCPICLDVLGRGVRKAPCGHKFHGVCMRSWVAKVHDWHCPLCVAGCGVDGNRVKAGAHSVSAADQTVASGRVSV